VHGVLSPSIAIVLEMEDVDEDGDADGSWSRRGRSLREYCDRCSRDFGPNAAAGGEGAEGWMSRWTSTIATTEVGVVAQSYK